MAARIAAQMAARMAARIVARIAADHRPGPRWADTSRPVRFATRRPRIAELSSAEDVLWPAGATAPTFYAGLGRSGLRDADMVCAGGRAARAAARPGFCVWMFPEDAGRLRWMSTLDVLPGLAAGDVGQAAGLAPLWAAWRRHRGGLCRGPIPSRAERMVLRAVEQNYAEPAALGRTLRPDQAELAIFGINGENSETRMVQLRPWHERTGSRRTYRSAAGFAAGCGLGGPLTRADRRALRLGHLR